MTAKGTNITRLKIELDARGLLLRELLEANARELALVEELEKYRNYARSLERELGRGTLTAPAAVPVPSVRERSNASWTLSDIIDETFDVIERDTTDPTSVGPKPKESM